MPESLIRTYCYSAAIIRPEDGALLIVQRADSTDSADSFAGHWELPGGHAEPGESIQTTLRRTVRAQTGLDIYVPKFEPYFGFTTGDNMDRLELHFSATSENEPVLTRHQAFQWITGKAQLDSLQMTAMMRQSLLRVLELAGN